MNEPKKPDYMPRGTPLPQRAPKRKIKPNKASRQWSSAGLKK